MTNFRQSEKLLKDIAKQVEIDDHSFNHEFHNYIYHMLKNQNVPKKEQKVDLSQEGIFKNWCREQRDRTKVFISPSNPYMCQFVSRDTKALGKSEHFKAILPFDSEHMEKGVNDVIKFLDSNRIPHHTKVGSHINSYNVVVSLISEDELLKLLLFVKDNDYLQEGLLKPNSFIYSENKVGLVCDGGISYINVLATYILLYMRKLKETNCLENVSLKGLYHFIIEYYARTFVQERDPSRPNILKKFQEDFYPMDKKVIDINDPTVLDDFSFTTKLIIESQAKDFQMDSFVKHLGILRNKKLNDRSINFDNVDKTLTELIEIMIRKGDSNYNMWNIEKYIETGEAIYLTNFEECRRRISNSTFREDLLYMLEQKHIDIHDYIMAFYDRMFMLDDKVVDLVKEYIAYGAYKYGKEDTRAYLEGYITTETDAYITRNSDFRDRFKKNNVSSQIRLFMKATGKNIDDVIDLCTPRLK